MGWRERDWAKFSEAEWAAYLGVRRGHAPLPPSPERTARRPEPMVPAPPRRKRARGRRQRASEAFVAGFAVLGVLVFAYSHIHAQKGSSAAQLATPPPPLVTTPMLVQPSSDVLALHWRASDLAPASRAGRVCVTDATRGRICASYVVGEQPADALTRQIEAMGLHVESVGNGS